MTVIVDIAYREPSYETRHGIKPEPYRWRYVVEADSLDRATRLALDEFRRMEALSSVGWRRDIVSIDVSPR